MTTHNPHGRDKNEIPPFIVDTHTHGAHGHTHGVVDPNIASTSRGLWAVKWSFVGLMLTAIFQVVIVILSGSVALLADTIHNFGDAATAIPLGIAFLFARRKPSQRFAFGFGKVEDLAGIAIVLTITFSAVVAGYQSIYRLFNPQEVSFLWAVIAASIIGFLGNEAVAIFRIKVGKEIGSAALVADGYHARTDGWTSLAVLFGAIGVWLGFPLADPIVGLIITAMIMRIVWQSVGTVFGRVLDGVDPEIVQDLTHAAHHVQGVQEVSEVRARWIGHRIRAELNIAVEPTLSVEAAHGIATQVNHELMHHVKFLASASIHVDPADKAGEQFHKIASHTHNGLPMHSHG